MVKDLRTGHETANTGAVLDGDLDAFMQAELERLATGGRRRARTPGARRADRRRRARGPMVGAATAPGERGVTDRPAAPTTSPACAGIWRDGDQRLHRAA